MPLTAQTQAVLEAMRKANLRPVEDLTPTEARAQFAAMTAARRAAAAPVAVARIENRRVPGSGGDIPVRLFWPDRAGSLPAVIYFHGGGHVIGNIDTHDDITRIYSAGAGALVVSVDYRKGPEHRFPAAVEDVQAVIDWLFANASALGVDRTRLALAGDSAGANLAAVGAFHVRDAGLPSLALQVLVYPVIDFSLGSASYHHYAAGYGVLTAKAMTWFRGHYLGRPEDAQDWRASPIRAGSFAGLAPAIVVTAECDVLHDEGVAYVRALRAAGVSVEHKTYQGVIHGFFVMSHAVDEAGQAQRAVLERLKAAFGS